MIEFRISSNIAHKYKLIANFLCWNSILECDLLIKSISFNQFSDINLSIIMDEKEFSV